MSHRKKINSAGENVSVQYQNLFAQIISLIAPRKLYAILGRGSAKTTEIQVERLIDVIYDMPGAPCIWIADTFSNLTANILPGVLEGLERKGFHEGTHYVVEKEPPTFTEKEKAKLPKWLKPHFWKPFNRLVSYKRTIIFFTGTNIRFGSLDRPSTVAGGSYVYVFGDEVKYFKEAKIANLMKAVRGYRAQYGNSVFYRGVSFTTDMPNIANIGEDDWILKEQSNVNVPMITTVLKTGLVLNEANHEYAVAKQKWLQNKSNANLEECNNKLRTANRWRVNWEELRKEKTAQTFVLIASSYVNVDILTESWFDDAIAAQMNDFNTAILSCRPKLESGNRFYTALSERHFYFDGIDEKEYEKVELRGVEDCRVLRYLNKNRSLELGVDFGLMCSMIVAQDNLSTNELRLVKFIHTLSPDFVPELAEKFRNYFAPMVNKSVKMYYDPSANSYKAVNRDFASELKQCIEVDKLGKRTGWRVTLMSVGKRAALQSAEYYFMQKFLSGDEPRVPKLLIDAYAAKGVKKSIENARTLIKNHIVYKDKRSERLPVEQLFHKSTNASDAFKALLMRPTWVNILKDKKSLPSGIEDPSFNSG